MTSLLQFRDMAAPIFGNTFNARVDADSIMASLARRDGLTLSGDGGVLWFPHERATIRKAVGSVTLKSGVVVNAEHFFKITAWQDDYARRLVHFANHHLSHDGTWGVMWLNPTADGYATELRFAFQDKDGDAQFVVHSDRTLVDLQTREDVSTHGNNLEHAYQQWRGFMQEVDVRPDQTIKAAQGQKPKDANIQPLI